MSITHPRSCVMLLGLWAAVSGARASAQPTPTRHAATLLRAVPAASAMVDAGQASELTIRWRVSDTAADEPLLARDPAPLNQFQLVAQRPVTGLVRERAPQLSIDSLVVIVVDGSGREVAWQQVRDPRVIRAEAPGPNAELSGQTLYRPLTDLVVTIPEGLAPSALRVCEVQWNGTEFVLQELGDVAVAR